MLPLCHGQLGHSYLSRWWGYTCISCNGSRFWLLNQWLYVQTLEVVINIKPSLCPWAKCLTPACFKVTVPVISKCLIFFGLKVSVKWQITETDQNFTLIYNIESVKIGYCIWQVFRDTVNCKKIMGSREACSLNHPEQLSHHHHPAASRTSWVEGII